MKKRIALLYGGASSEHDVSVMGYEYVSELLTDAKYEILPVYIDTQGSWSVSIGNEKTAAYPTAKNGGCLLTAHGCIGVDVAIPLLHGEGGEDGRVQGALECANIPYVGAKLSTGAVCIDKAYTKAVAESLGIPTARGVTPRSSADTDEVVALCEKTLAYPMFIKPRRLGSSVGAHPVRNKDELARLYPTVSEQCGAVMIEECFSTKRELECAFAEIGGIKIITPPGEILIDGFYGYAEKYGGGTRVNPRAQIDLTTERTLAEHCERLADALMLRHLGRIDFFLTDRGVVFNEVNTFPGFTKESLYPKMLEAYGISVGAALSSFIEDALGW